MKHTRMHAETYISQCELKIKEIISKLMLICFILIGEMSCMNTYQPERDH